MHACTQTTAFRLVCGVEQAGRPSCYQGRDHCTGEAEGKGGRERSTYVEKAPKLDNKLLLHACMVT